MSEPEPGWYPDPRGVRSRAPGRRAGGWYRWWDGHSWTRELSDSPGAPEPTSDAGDAPDPVREAPVTVAPTPTPTPTPPRFDPRTSPAYASGPRRLRVRPDVLVGVAALVVVLVAAAVVVVVRNQAALAAPPLAPPTPVSNEAVAGYSSTTRKAEVEDVTATFPDSPWLTQLVRDPQDGLFTKVVYSELVVHENYRGKHDWSANIFLGSVDPALVDAEDGKRTAKNVLAKVRKEFYSGDIGLTQVPVAAEQSEVKGRTITRTQVDLRFRIKGLPSRYDRVTIFVIPPLVPTRPTVVWMTLRPDDLGKSELAQLNESLGSLDIP